LVKSPFSFFLQIDNKIKGPLKTSIEHYYQGSKGFNAISLGWNIIMNKASVQQTLERWKR